MRILNAALNTNKYSFILQYKAHNRRSSVIRGGCATQYKHY